MSAAATAERSGPPLPSSVGASGPLASCFEGGKTSHLHWLASQWVSLVLEVEVAAAGEACRSN
jgi:hypothetical protein